MQAPRCSAPSTRRRSTERPSGSSTHSASRSRQLQRAFKPPRTKMTEATFPQCRIVTERLLNPETTERLLNQICSVAGVRRMVLNGPRLPATVTYGPAKGLANPHTMRKMIHVGDQELELQVHVGTILLEIENRDIIPALQTACKPVFTDYSFYIQEGRFMKTEPSLTDYCKYGPDADKTIIGLTDPSSKSRPIIIQGNK